MPLIQFRAGRCERRAGTNWVDPQPGRGLITLDEEDGLLHFQYKDIESNSNIDDLILFPGDATFTQVSTDGGRTYVLRFTSSSARHFYWMQDVEDTQDSRRASRVNALIDDPQAPEAPEGDVEMSSSSSSAADAPAATTARPASPSAETTDSAAPPSTTTPISTSAPLDLPAGVTAEQYAQLQALLAQHADPSAASSSSASTLAPTVSLSDILSPSRLLSLLASGPPGLAESLYQYLPSADTGSASSEPAVPHTPESLRRIATNTDLRKSARSLDQALASGALGPLAQSLGLREDETFGVENYLRGVQRLADEEKAREGDNSSTSKGSESEAGKGSDNMQTD